MTIFLTFRNADMTEGRGPMIPDLAFLYKEHADAYVDSKPGVMGRSGRWSTTKYGDWEVRPLEVLECAHELDEGLKRERRERALAKLTMEDREILGIK